MEVIKEQVQLAFEKEEYNTAENLAREYLKFDNNDLEIRIILGLSSVQLGKLKDALVIFQKAHQSSPEDSQVIYCLALTYEISKNIPKSLEYYKKIIWDKSYGALANYRMGLIYSDSSKEIYNAKFAIHFFLAATESEHPIEDAFLKLATLENGMRSIYVLESGIKAFPKSEELHTRLALYYLNLVGDFASSVETVKNAQLVGIDSPDLRFICSLANYHLDNYSEALNILDDIEIEEDNNEILLLKSIVYMEKEEFDTSLRFLREIIKADIGNRLKYTAHLIALCCCIRGKNLKEIAHFTDEIPLDVFGFYDSNLYFINFSGTLDIGKYLLVALDSSHYPDTDEKLIAKIDGLKALYLSLKDNKEKKDWKLIEKLVTSSLKAYPENSVLLKLKGDCCSAFNKSRNAIYHYVLAQLVSNKNIYVDIETEIGKIITNGEEMSLTLNDMENLLGLYKWNVDNFSTYLLHDIVRTFFNNKKYGYVEKICVLFQYKYLIKANVIFELAYSYWELKNKTKSKQYYEAYLRDVGENASVYNNLALIYEKDRLLDKAKELLVLAIKAEPENEIYANNLNRIQKEIDLHIQHSNKSKNYCLAISLINRLTTDHAISAFSFETSISCLFSTAG